MDSPIIFSYLNYREFLKDFYKFKKATQPKYSYAVFSMRAGIKSPNYLKLVMEGVRNLTNDNVLRFAKALNLTDQETVFWENLVAFTQAKSLEQRQHYFIKLTHGPLPKNSGVREIRDEWELLSSWHHLAIRELILLPTFKEDPSEIVRLLGGKITAVQAKESLELLQRMKFLKRDENGRLVQAEREIRYFSKEDLRNIAVQRFHRSTGDLAMKLLTELAPSERDFSGLTIAVTEEALPKLKLKITEFRKELNQEFSQLSSAHKVIQVNFQLFPLSK